MPRQTRAIGLGATFTGESEWKKREGRSAYNLQLSVSELKKGDRKRTVKKVEKLENNVTPCRRMVRPEGLEPSTF